MAFINVKKLGQRMNKRLGKKQPMQPSPRKLRHWNGKDLHGRWLATRKLDGVRAIISDTRKGIRAVSRNNKPLYNLEKVLHLFTDAEIFCGSLKATLGKVRASRYVDPVLKEEVFQLNPPDKRLVICELKNPTAETIRNMLAHERRAGSEGMVLRPIVSLDYEPTAWLKVKAKETHDVRCTGIQPGKGKHRGRIGALITPKGEVGTGLTDKQRALPPKDFIGKVIEVECTEFTEDGKFRHARFKRVRWDK